MICDVTKIKIVEKLSLEKFMKIAKRSNRKKILSELHISFKKISLERRVKKIESKIKNGFFINFGKRKKREIPKIPKRKSLLKNHLIVVSQISETKKNFFE